MHTIWKLVQTTRHPLSKCLEGSRTSQQLNIPSFKTKTGQQSFFYRIVNIWNNLPSEIKLSQSLNNFEHNLRRHLLKNFLQWAVPSSFYPALNTYFDQYLSFISLTICKFKLSLKNPHEELLINTSYKMVWRVVLLSIFMSCAVVW